MNQLTSMYKSIVCDLEVAGRERQDSSDANEPDPRYKSYSVRAPRKR
jgi:hypothetical protein